MRSDTLQRVPAQFYLPCCLSLPYAALCSSLEKQLASMFAICAVCGACVSATLSAAALCACHPTTSSGCSSFRIAMLWQQAVQPALKAHSKRSHWKTDQNSQTVMSRQKGDTMHNTGDRGVKIGEFYDADATFMV